MLMGAATLAGNMAALRAGKTAATPAACVRWGTRRDQHVVSGTVGDHRGAGGGAAWSADCDRRGRGCALADELAWFEPGPLAGRAIVVTRARAQASELRRS